MAPSDEPRLPTRVTGPSIRKAGVDGSELTGGEEFSLPRSSRPWRRPRNRNFPVLLIPILLVAVIGLASAVMAVILSPTVAGIDATVTRLNRHLQEQGSGFRRLPRPPERSVIYASDGKTELATVYLDENREIVRLKDVSKPARRAVLAIEDRDFYKHGPLNFESIIRAAIANFTSGTVVQGGSTITQQLVKNTLIQDPAPTITRKVQEAALAMRVEEKYSKREILDAYLNEVYLGKGIYGIGTAADFYFGVPAAKLSLAQGAILAGMIASPEDFDPIDHPKRAKRRRNQVLDAMVEVGWAKPATAAKIQKQPMELPKTAGTMDKKQRVLPPIVRYLTQQIIANKTGEYDAFGSTEKQRTRTLYQGGLRIVTTLNADWQRAAERIARRRLTSKPDTAIVSVENDTGAIRTLLSGKNFAQDQLALATTPQQPGSSFKPFTLVAAFEKGISPSTRYPSSSPQRVPGWGGDNLVENAEPGGGGNIDLWQATQFSVNVVFAQLVMDVGPEKVVEVAKAMGVTSELSPYPSITLGAEEVSPLDMAASFQTLANGGKHCKPFAIQRVSDPEGTLYRHQPQCKQVIPENIANLTTAMMERVVTGGTGTAAQIGRPVAGKTGTTQDATDVWFVGFTPQVSTAVWIGLPGENEPMYQYFPGTSVYGGTIAAPIWQDYMLQVMSGLPVQGFPPAPSTIGKPTPTPSSKAGERVPGVVGLSSSAARAAIEDAGFVASERTVDSEKPKGTVVAQSPAAGARADPGSTVSIDVSSGRPQAVRVPSVVGQSGASAKSELRAAGFGVSVSVENVVQDDKIGIVIGQSPAGGAEASPGSTVTITIGRKA